MASTTTTSAAVRPLSLDPATVGRGDTYEAWRSLTSPFFDTRPLRAVERFDAWASAYWVEDVLVSRVRFEASMFWRRPDRFPAGRSDLVTLQWYVSGALRGSADDHDLYMAPDRICFHDFALPYLARSERSEVWGLALPRERIAEAGLLRARSPVLSIAVGSPSGLLLSGALRAAWQALSGPATGAQNAHELVSGLVGLINGVLHPAVHQLGDDDRRAALKQYIRRRLPDPALSGAELQRHFHYSRATIYRLLEPDGGVAHFIRAERLRRCHDELAHPHPARRTTVANVAARWGYPDPAQFSRAFRAQYGHSPGELLRAAQPPQMSSTNRPSARSPAIQVCASSADDPVRSR